MARFTFIKNLKVGNIKGSIRDRAAFHIDSDEGGFILPEFTTAERDLLWVPPLVASDKGAVIYNSTAERIQFHIGASWLSLDASTPPSNIAATYVQYADDATYVANQGVAVNGSVYYNTTDLAVRVYSNGAWYYDIPVVAWDNAMTFLETQIVYDGIMLYHCNTTHLSNSAGTLLDDITNWDKFGAHNIGELLDVDMTTLAPADGDVVSYDGTSFVPTKKNTIEGELIIKEVTATPDTPASGYGKIYLKSDKRLYYLDSTGTETLVETVMNIVDLFDNEYESGLSIEASTGALYTVVASTAEAVKRVQMYDTTGLFLGWYVDGTLSWVSGPGTNEQTDIEIAAGALIQVRSITTDAGTSGELSANFLA